MNLEERVVAAEVASRRADGPGVIEVQSQRRSDVAGQGLGPRTQWRGRPVRPGSRGVRRPGADQDARLWMGSTRKSILSGTHVLDF